MIYQRGTLYVCGKRRKSWYGKYLVYETDENGEQVRRERNRKVCPKAGVPRWEAQELLDAMIAEDNRLQASQATAINNGIDAAGGGAQTSHVATTPIGQSPVPVLISAGRETSSLISSEKAGQQEPCDSIPNFREFVLSYYIPKRQGQWSIPYAPNARYHLEHYLIGEYGDRALSTITDLEIQSWLNGLAEKLYSKSVIKQCFDNIRAVFKYAKKKGFIADIPTEDLKMPKRIKPVKKDVITSADLLRLLAAIVDLRDLTLFSIAVFCGPRSSEAMGFQWKCWNGISLTPFSIAYKGQFLEGELKSAASGQPIPVPEEIWPVIDAWKRACLDPAPEALMFPTYGRGKRKGQLVPQDPQSFLNNRIRPIAKQLGIPTRLMTFQVLRRTLGTDLQRHGTLKDAQRILRHGTMQTTGNVYQQPIEECVNNAMNSRTSAILGVQNPIVAGFKKEPREMETESQGDSVKSAGASSDSPAVPVMDFASNWLGRDRSREGIVPPRAVPLLQLRNDRARLQRLVWSVPLRKLAEQYGVSDVAFGKACRALDIALPGRGHWNKVAAGLPVPPCPPLKPLSKQ